MAAGIYPDPKRQRPARVHASSLEPVSSWRCVFPMIYDNGIGRLGYSVEPIEFYYMDSRERARKSRRNRNI